MWYLLTLTLATPSLRGSFVTFKRRRKKGEGGSEIEDLRNHSFGREGILNNTSTKAGQWDAEGQTWMAKQKLLGEEPCVPCQAEETSVGNQRSWWWTWSHLGLGKITVGRGETGTKASCQEDTGLVINEPLLRDEKRRQLPKVLKGKVNRLCPEL